MALLIAIANAAFWPWEKDTKATKKKAPKKTNEAKKEEGPSIYDGETI